MGTSIYSMTSWLRKAGAMILAGLVLGSFTGQAALIEENFNSYDNGNLGGQGGWVTTATYGPVQVIDGSGVNSTKVISNSSNTLSGTAEKAVSIDWGGAVTAELSVDLYRVGGTGIDSWAGLMSAATTRGYGVRLRTADIGFRTGSSGGNHIIHTDISGKIINITNEKWYRITYEFTLTDNTITKATLYNLSDGGSSQLYFGANQATYTPEAGTPTAWNQMKVRTPQSYNGVVMFDNISVTAIPEPATIGMMLLGSIGALSIRRFLP